MQSGKCISYRRTFILRIASVELPSRTSFVFYLGLEGFGGLEMETDEDENVSCSKLVLSDYSDLISQGLEGIVKFTGNTPDLGDFTVRISDGKIQSKYFHGRDSYIHIGPDNTAVWNAPHANAFSDRIGKTHFLGARTHPGEVWKARGIISS